MDQKTGLSKRAAITLLSSFIPVVIFFFCCLAIYLGGLIETILGITLVVVSVALAPKGFRHLTSDSIKARDFTSFTFGILGIFSGSYIAIITWVIPINDNLSSLDEIFYRLLVITWFIFGVLQIMTTILVRSDLKNKIGSESQVTITDEA